MNKKEMTNNEIRSKIYELEKAKEKCESNVEGRKAEYENSLLQQVPKIKSIDVKLENLREMMIDNPEDIRISKQAKIDFVNLTAFDIVRSMLRTIDINSMGEGFNLVTIGDLEFVAEVKDNILVRFEVKSS